MSLKKIIAGLALSLATLTSGCTSLYQANIGKQYKCERTSGEDFRLFKDNKLLVEKASKLNDVFDFYQDKNKVARLSLLPDGTTKLISTEKGEKLIRQVYPIIKKCNETLEKKYLTNFLAREE